ncbi:MAG: hypothetical protein JST91_29740 [Actinobacteria bacterium]|nr:hypothetical protein [Actinomycetota bacterium]
MAEFPTDHPQDPQTWITKALADLADARTYAFEGRSVEESLAMRSAGVASVLAARRTRDRGGELSPLWLEALAHDDEVEAWQQVDLLQAEYYRERAIHLGLLAAIELENATS